MKVCPTDSELHRFMTVNLAQDQAKGIQGHIDDCPSCQQRIKSGRVDDSLFADLKLAIKARSDQELAHADSATKTSSEGAFRKRLKERGYEIIDELHRGGQGIVYQATQLATQRLVAVKRLFVRNGPRSELQTRFEREVDIIARLSHPNIVTVFDSGIEADYPYFVMEWVDGIPLDVYRKQQFHQCSKATSNLSRPAVREIIELFRSICSAVNFAHRTGIIHRDLKPANILIDRDGQPKVLDFGLAKAIEKGSFHQLTQSGQFLGTLAYASPEQVQVNSRLVDVRTDVYSLGVVLYEMLTNQLPYSIDGSLSQIVTNIVDASPVKPKTICHWVDEDVQTIVLRALDKDPNRRFQSVEQLDRDLGLYLQGRPIESKRDKTLYVVKKTIIRHRRLVAAASLLLAIVIGAFVAISIFWDQAVKQRNVAQVATQSESKAREEAEFSAYVANIAATKGSVLSFDVAEARRRLESAPLAYRNWEWRYWQSRIDQSLRTIQVHALYVRDFDFIDAGKSIVSFAGSGTIKSWSFEDPSKQKEAHLRPESLSIDLRHCVVNDQANWFAILVDLKTIQIFDATSLSKRFEYSLDGTVLGLCKVPGSQMLAVLHSNEPENTIKVTIWDPLTDVKSEAFRTYDSCQSIEAHTENDCILLAGDKPGILNVATKKLSPIQNVGTCLKLKPSPQGRRIAAMANNEIIIADSETGKRLCVLSGHKLPITDFAFSHDGHQISSVSDDRTIRTWDVTTGVEVSRKVGHENRIRRIRYVPGSNQVITASDDANFKVWDTTPNLNPRRIEHQSEAIRTIRFHPTKPIMVYAGDEGRVYLRNQQTGKVVRTLDFEANVFSVDFNHDGSQLAVAGDHPEIRVWDTINGTIQKFEGNTDRVNKVRFSPDGKKLLSGSRDKSVRVWDVESGLLITTLFDHDGCVHGVAFDAKGTRFASRSHNDVRLWDSDSFEQLFVFPQRIGTEDYSLQFHPDGVRLASGTSIAGYGRGFVNLYDAVTGKTLGTFEQHNSPITAFDFSPDGTRAVSASHDSIKIWDVDRAEEVLKLDGVTDEVRSVQFSTDGNQIAAGLKDGTLLIWDTR